jgi:hypothetical protein
MILLEPQHLDRLRANAQAHRAAQDHGLAAPDPVPVVKFFNPIGAATWVATEIGEDGDTLFGLADLGFGCPELGYFSLREIAAIRLPFGLRIESDLGFDAQLPLSAWADAAQLTGSILHARTLIRELVAAGRPPTSSHGLEGRTGPDELPSDT